MTLEEAAEEYAESQFALAESRTVSRYCNDETFATAFIAGAEWAFKEVERLDKLAELVKES
jgi:hypothetical protein